MINKNIKKILDSKKIKKVGNLKLNLRPSEIALTFTIKLPRFMRR